MMSGDATPAQIGAFLMALRVRGETVEEITGAVRTMRAKMTKIRAPARSIDIGRHRRRRIGTYNISTARRLSSPAAACRWPSTATAPSRPSPARPTCWMRSASISRPAPRWSSARSSRAASASCWRRATTAPCAMSARAGRARHPHDLQHPGAAVQPGAVKRQLIGVFASDWIEPMARVLGNLGRRARLGRARLRRPRRADDHRRRQCRRAPRAARSASSR